MGGSGGTFLNIPGNIKQTNLPFVLDPTNSINVSPINIADENGQSKLEITGSPVAQLFSFKPSAFSTDEAAKSEKAGFLRIAPASFYNENGGQDISYTRPNEDLSYKLLYDNKQVRGASTKPSATMQNILNSLPSVSVREYLQDSKLNQVVNLFQSLIAGFDQGTKFAGNAEESSLKEFASKLWTFTTKLMAQLPDIAKSAVENVSNDLVGTFARTDMSADESLFVLKIPYLLYYRMISATTTNIYELPYSGKIMYQSDGTQGWNRDNGLGGISTQGSSILGNIVNYLAGNIKVNTTPTWTPKDSQPIKVEMSFDLYNDTCDGAIKNFIFINTLVPGNKFLQYHIYQHAPNLYDVRIDGINRLFMCAATIKVDQIGVLRTPSRAFTDKLGMHMNNIYISQDQLHSYIRIPDIYRVTVSFESLLPDSFNNYIYQYQINEPIPTKIEGKALHTESAYEKFAEGIADSVAALWYQAVEKGMQSENIADMSNRNNVNSALSEKASKQAAQSSTVVTGGITA